MVSFALILVLLQLGNYCGVQCQQPTSVTGLQPTPLTVNRELQRLTEEVAQVKESINDLRNILQGFGDEFALVRQKLGDVEKECKHDEILQTCTPPQITHLGFTHGPISSDLICISTGSPATTVTWMRDGQPLTIDGTTYYVTYRSTSATYEHILTINAAVSTIYRHTYTCTVRNALGSDSQILTSPPPPIATISPPGGTPTAGESFSLTCSVTLADGGSLTDDLLVHWEAPVDINMDSDIKVMTSDSTVTRTSTLRFTTVRTSHGGKYTCKATTTGGTDVSTKALTVQIPPPTLSMSRDPDASVTLRHGDPLTLTCTIQLDPDPAVDNDVVVTGNLQGRAGRNSTIVKASDGVYIITLYIPSILATASDTYTCSATVEPDSGVMYVHPSGLTSTSLDITVELAVNISVSYTPPPGFIPGPNEYRAASGPVNVTCIARGGIGPVNYQWSSTCRVCPFQSAALSSIWRLSVHSGDTGTHTCTATSDSGINGSASISFNVVGAGIHVFRGASTGSLQVPGSLPNNGIVISLNTAKNKFSFRFFCRSDSMMDNIGILVGLNGTTITTNDTFGIVYLIGQIVVEKTPSQDILTARDQGVYTCRISLQSGEMRDINIGIYPSGFNTPPSIAHLGFTHGSNSSNLTCISTASPATNVTWMRDGQPLTIDGSVYQTAQKVSNRRETTYENVLTINATLPVIYRHNYTCTVINALGSDSETLTAFPLPKVTISRSPGTPTAGKSFYLICTVTLEDGGSLTKDLIARWITHVDISNVQVMTTDSTVTRTSTLRFTSVLTSHGGNYTCKATTTGGADMATETLTVQIPPPALAMSRAPDANELLCPGDPLTLTCTIRLDPATVDIDVIVTGRLAGPGGSTTSMIASAGEYRIIIDIPLLRATSFGTYVCTATVMPGPGVMHVDGSESQSSLDITVCK